MSSIAGFFHYNKNFQEQPRLYRPCLEKMNDVQKHRGRADSSIYLIFTVVLLLISLSLATSPLIFVEKMADYMPLCWMVFYTILTN